MSTNINKNRNKNKIKNKYVNKFFFFFQVEKYTCIRIYFLKLDINPASCTIEL